ncbi:uncharacterized protein LOC143022129 [Oratosquilla oratoria]|uniref:uncharacterized protein LOC143022129 n=1 Tax=Oratosquilla oratoria TaxID=337810 RepID=UPI003F75DBDD
MSEIMDPEKLKVAKLRTELQSRKLDSKGNKPVLVVRLREALEAETAEGAETSLIDVEDAESEPETEPEFIGEPSSGDEFEQESQEKQDLKFIVTEIKEEEAAPQMKEELQDEEVPMAVVKYEAFERNDEVWFEEVLVKGIRYEYDNGKSIDIKEEPVEIKEEEAAPQVKEELQDKEMPLSVIKNEPCERNESVWFEQVLVEDIKYENDNEESMNIKEESVEVKVESSEEWRRGEKRAADGTKMTPAAKKFRSDVEDEYEFDKSLVVLDRYNSDMSLIISKEDRLSAYPITGQSFSSVWHGVRATYGFTIGKVFYEMKVMEHLSVPHLEADEEHPHVIRVGWSVDNTGLMLGEEPLSYGYEGTAKASSNLKLKDYGIKFGKGDVVGCFLDLDVQPAVILFSVNGEHQGIAYEIHHREIGDAALFPHIVTKKSSFQVNFGQEDPWFEPLTGYTALQKVPLKERVLAMQEPEEYEDCESAGRIIHTSATLDDSSRLHSRILHSQAKEIIYNVNKYFLQEKANRGPLLPPTQALARTAKATNVSKSTVKRILSTCNTDVAPRKPTFSSPKERIRSAPVTDFDDFDKNVLRRCVVGFYERKEIPTLYKIKEELREKISFDGCLHSLRKVLLQSGFKYAKVDGRKFLMERNHIVAARTRFLRTMQKLRQLSHNFVYLDETWVGRCWTDTKSPQATGVNPSTEKGNCVIIVHAGTRDGFVCNAELIFQAKNDGDYHKQMNASFFEEWFKKQLIPNIMPNSVIIMDNASCHNAMLEKVPTPSWRKGELKDWLIKKRVQPSSALSKAELYELAQNKICKDNTKYAIDTIAEEAGHRIVRIPPYHCQYNPTELIWAQVKSYVAKNSSKMADLNILAKEAIDSVTPVNWMEAVRHAEEFQKRDAVQDITIEKYIESFRINITESSDDEYSD